MILIKVLKKILEKQTFYFFRNIFSFQNLKFCCSNHHVSFHDNFLVARNWNHLQPLQPLTFKPFALSLIVMFHFSSISFAMYNSKRYKFTFLQKQPFMFYRIKPPLIFINVRAAIFTCMTDHHLKVCRQVCKFCISSKASKGERKKLPSLHSSLFTFKSV